jgi:hypothetical protein
MIKKYTIAKKKNTNIMLRFCKKNLSDKWKSKYLTSQHDVFNEFLHQNKFVIEKYIKFIIETDTQKVFIE